MTTTVIRFGDPKGVKRWSADLAVDVRKKNSASSARPKTPSSSARPSWNPTRAIRSTSTSLSTCAASVAVGGRQGHLPGLRQKGRRRPARLRLGTNGAERTAPAPA
jgi:hypothetical protein